MKKQTTENRYPPREPYEPVKPERSHYDVVGATEKKNIYYNIEVLGDSDFDLEQHFEDYDEEVPAPPDKRYFQNLSLQDVVDLAPPNAKLSDIILHIHFPRMMEYMEVSFDYIKRNEQEEERVFQEAIKKYEKDYVKYQQELIVYQKELADYREWQRDTHIKELEEQLNQLKK